MVQDSSFEACTRPPDSLTSWTVLKHWKNANPKGTRDPNGTPDYLHADGKSRMAKLPESYFGVIHPHSGKGVVGLLVFHDVWVNSREYIYTELKEPMKIGKVYEVSFWLCNGEDKFYGEYAANGFSALLSTEPVYQKGHEIIKAVPQVEVDEAVFHTSWKKYTFVYYADKPYRYLTLGSFTEDKDVIQRHYLTGETPQRPKDFSYFFVDDVNVIEKDNSWKDKEILAMNTRPDPKLYMIPADLPVYRDIKIIATIELSNVPPAERYPNATAKVPKKLDGRKVVKPEVVEVETQKIVLSVYDARAEDRDTISLCYNGEWLLRQEMVRNKPVQIEIEVDPRHNNTLIFFAHNLGAIPPNTANVSFMDGDEKHVIQVKSDLKKCGAIQLRLKSPKKAVGESEEKAKPEAAKGKKG
ncbi:MAG: hypothetical protein ACKVTZ_22260 [Bacteroidia bacterium]